MTKKGKVAVWLLFISVLIGLAIWAVTSMKGSMDEASDAGEFLELNRDLQQSVVVDKNQKISSFMEDEDIPATFDIDITVDFEELLNINQDIIAWLYIPGTYISFPVLQERVLMEYYYLNHDYKGERLSAGSIFTPAQPLGIEDAHLLLFGHNMRREGVAFSGLHALYSDWESGKENRYIYLLYPDRTERWELWCAVESNQDDAVYEIPYQLETESYASLLKEIAGRASYQEGEIPSADERTVVLSTCNGAAGGPERFYVIFREAGAVDTK